MSVLITLCILLFSILIHETGHFLAARRFNYAVNEFSIGMGPKLIQKTKNEIAYTIRLLPLGGYVSFAEESKNQRCISAPSLSKSVVLIMGAAFNLLLSILCAFHFFLQFQDMIVFNLYMKVYALHVSTYLSSLVHLIRYFP